jgi:hypothetical protein
LEGNIATPRLSVGLVHWPCWNQRKEVVATNITNLDIHDIARASRTYGVHRYYLINRVQEQLMFVHRVLDHWRTGEGLEHNRQRREAVKMVRTAPTLGEAVADFPSRPIVVGTHARPVEGRPSIGFKDLREKMWSEPEQDVFLVLGTGWGLTPEVFEQCDLILDPIRGSSTDDYRHLSVRSAASIILDRLLGQW